MLRIVNGERIASSAQVFVGCSATIFDPERRKVLLTRRADNSQWCLPGGHFEPGESVAEACAREVLEETGLIVRIVRLIGVYSSPHRVLDYGDGQQYQVVALNFEAAPIGGALDLSKETTDYGYFSQTEIERLDLMEHHRERIQDAYIGRMTAQIR